MTPRQGGMPLPTPLSYPHPLSSGPRTPPPYPPTAGYPESYTAGGHPKAYAKHPGQSTQGMGTYHTPISPPRHSVPPHVAALMSRGSGRPESGSRHARTDSQGEGRKRSATVSGNGSADEKVYAGVRPVDPEYEQRLPTEQSPASSGPKPSGGEGQEGQETGRRRSSTISHTPKPLEYGSMPDRSLGFPSREEFMQGAAKLYQAFDQARSLLDRIEYEEKRLSELEARRSLLDPPSRPLSRQDDRR